MQTKNRIKPRPSEFIALAGSGQFFLQPRKGIAIVEVALRLPGIIWQVNNPSTLDSDFSSLTTRLVNFSSIIYIYIYIYVCVCVYVYVCWNSIIIYTIIITRISIKRRLQLPHSHTFHHHDSLSFEWLSFEGVPHTYSYSPRLVLSA